jgi:DNA-binding NarL/FixJ family response regulator
VTHRIAEEHERMRTTEKPGRPASPAQPQGAVIRILVADDHQIVRAGLARFISDQPDMKIVAEAASGDEVLALLDRVAPDVLLLDIAMPNKNGIDCLRSIRKTHPNLPVLILSGYPESSYAINSMRAGASGYLSKLAAPEEILRAIRMASLGRKYVSDASAGLLATELSHPRAELHAGLSEREFQVFIKLAQGQSITAIANELGLSAKTVTTYRVRLLQKLRLLTNADLTQYALRQGLFD